MFRYAAKPIATFSIDSLDTSIRSPSGNTHPYLSPLSYLPTTSEARYPLNPIKTSPTIYTRAAQDLNAGRKRRLFLSSRSGTRFSAILSIR